MAIQRWDPMRELREMDDSINRLWRSFGGSGAAVKDGGEDWNISLDVIQKPEEVVVKASVPGVKAPDIEVAVEDNVLTIKAERKAEDIGKDAEYLIRERPTGTFFRALRLPDIIDTEKIKSAYEAGVLAITMPRAEEKKKKQIKIDVTGA